MKTMFICFAIAVTISYSVLAEAEISAQGEQKKSMVVENNPLHSADYKELWNVYGHSNATSCVHYTRFVTTPMSTNYGHRQDAMNSARNDRKRCRKYVKEMPYTFEQVTDPRAINRYHLKSKLEDCKKYGKGLRKAAKCDQLESQQ
ncbi:MAG: hypothetical protein ABW168_11320 [Sedimenticola sp.]